MVGFGAGLGVGFRRGLGRRLRGGGRLRGRGFFTVVFVEVFDLALMTSRGRVGLVFGVLALPTFALAGGGGEGSAKTPVSKPACIESTSET